MLATGYKVVFNHHNEIKAFALTTDPSNQIIVIFKYYMNYYSDP